MDCVYCRITFKVKGKLDAHQKTKKCLLWRNVSFTCTVCNNHYWSIDSLRDHQKCNGSFEPLLIDGLHCASCDLNFDNRVKARLHLKTKKCILFRTIRCVCEKCGSQYGCGTIHNHVCRPQEPQYQPYIWVAEKIGQTNVMVELMDNFLEEPSITLLKQIKSLRETKKDELMDQIRNINTTSIRSTTMNGLLEGEGRLLLMFMVASDHTELFKLLYGSVAPCFVKDGKNHHITKVYTKSQKIHYEPIHSFVPHFYGLLKTVLQFMARVWLLEDVTMRDDPYILNIIKLIKEPQQSIHDALGSLEPQQLPVYYKLVMDPVKHTYRPFGSIIKEVSPSNLALLEPLMCIFDDEP